MDVRRVAVNRLHLAKQANDKRLTLMALAAANKIVRDKAVALISSTQRESSSARNEHRKNKVASLVFSGELVTAVNTDRDPIIRFMALAKLTDQAVVGSTPRVVAAPLTAGGRRLATVATI